MFSGAAPEPEEVGEEAVDANLGRGEGEAALGTSSFTVAAFKEKCRA